MQWCGTGAAGNAALAKARDNVRIDALSAAVIATGLAEMSAGRKPAVRNMRLVA